MKILADDRALCLVRARVICRQLDGAVQVLEADSCHAAIDHAHAHPGMDGIDCVVQFQHAHPAAMPLVVLSRSESHLSVQAVLDVGALGYVPKSYSAR